MRSAWFMVLSLSLVCCGGRVEVNGTAGSGGAGGSAAPSDHAQASCAPNDGPAVAIRMDGQTSCAPASFAGLEVLIWGADLDALHDGASFMFGSSVNATTQGYRANLNAQPVPVVSGSITFDTFTSGQSATGSYDVTYMDGTTEQASFNAAWCPGGATCG
jgi:hypothetical protein